MSCGLHSDRSPTRSAAARLRSQPESSHNSDLVGNFKSVVLLGEGDIGLLVAVRADECVHGSHLDVVKFLAGFLDQVLVGAAVDNKDESVVVFDRLNGGLSAQRMLHDSVFVPSALFNNAVDNSFGVAGESLAGRSVESGVFSDLGLLGLVGSFLHSGSSRLCLTS